MDYTKLTASIATWMQEYAAQAGADAAAARESPREVEEPPSGRRRTELSHREAGQTFQSPPPAPASPALASRTQNIRIVNGTRIFRPPVLLTAPLFLLIMLPCRNRIVGVP